MKETAQTVNWKKDRVKLSLWDICELIMLYVLSVVLLVAVTYVCKIPLTAFQMIGGYLIAVVIWKYRHRKMSLKLFLSIIIVVTLFFILLVYFCRNYIDSSWDSNTYHKLAIGQMKDGWNPVYETGYDFFLKHKNGTKFQKVKEGWATYYPKATWYFSAAMYSLTDNIETGKMINFLFVFMTFVVCYDYLRQRFFSVCIAIIIAFFLAVTPVSLVQLQTYYLDGVLANALTMIVALLVAITDAQYKRNKKDLFLMLGASIIIAGNLKYTGLIYAGFFCAAFYIYWLVLCWQRKREQFTRVIKNLTIWYVTVVLITVGLVGASSYMRNIVYDGNPFYPLLGKNKVDIISAFAPDSFQETNSYIDYLKIFFSKTENVKQDNIHYKLPFSFDKDEFDIYDIDTRRGGFGPMFSGIAIICWLIVLHALFWLWKHDRDSFWPLAMITALSVLLVGITEGSWWARYSPYIWLSVMAGVLIMLLFVQRHNTWFYRFVSLLFLCVMLVNLLPFAKRPFAYAVKSSNEARQVLSTLSEKKIYIYFDGEWWGSIYDLEDYGIPYQIVYDKEQYGCDTYIPALHLYYSYH